jgi:hypothetical protein
MNPSISRRRQSHSQGGPGRQHRGHIVDDTAHALIAQLDEVLQGSARGSHCGSTTTTTSPEPVIMRK